MEKLVGELFEVIRYRKSGTISNEERFMRSVCSIAERMAVQLAFQSKGQIQIEGIENAYTKKQWEEQMKKVRELKDHLPELYENPISCTFSEAWRGACGKEADESGFCPDHKGIVCVSCGEQATHECHETMGFICGAPLCEDCEHEIAKDGTNGRSFKHCKKTEQKYEPWYRRGE